MKLPDGYVAGQGVQKPTGYGGFGERMLRTMGWDKGQGLGKEKQGMKAAIEVKKKEDTVGVS
jgi:G-patch domain